MFMKKLLLVALTVLSLYSYGQHMQGTIKPGATARTIDVYLKSALTFSQKDDAMTFVVALPANITPAPTGTMATQNPAFTSSGVGPNSLGAQTGISGLTPTFLVNTLGSTSREVVVGRETI